MSRNVWVFQTLSAQIGAGGSFPHFCLFADPSCSDKNTQQKLCVPGYPQSGTIPVSTCYGDTDGKEFLTITIQHKDFYTPHPRDTRQSYAFYAHAPSSTWAMEAGNTKTCIFTNHSLRNPQPNFYMHATLIRCQNSCALPGSSW